MVVVDPWPEGVFLDSAKSKGLMQAGSSPLSGGAPAAFAPGLSVVLGGMADEDVLGFGA